MIFRSTMGPLLNVLVIYVVQIVYTSAITIKVDLDAALTDSEICNDAIQLTKNDISTVTATMKAGRCLVTHKILPIKGDENCDRLCFKPLSDPCKSPAKLDIIAFSPDNKKQVMIFDCQSNSKTEWCAHTMRLKVGVLDRNQTAVDDKYQFRAEVRLECSKAPIVFTKQWHKDNEDKKFKAKVEGIVVGCCLASIFLVVLLVMYFYYKAKPTDGPPDDSVVKVKVSALTGLRETLTSKISRRKRRKRGNSQSSSRRPSQLSQRSGISATYEEARRLSQQRTELKPPEMLTPTGAEVTDSTSTLAVESETKPLCEENGIP